MSAGEWGARHEGRVHELGEGQAHTEEKKNRIELV